MKAVIFLLIIMILILARSVLAQDSNNLLAPNGVPGETIYVPFPVEIVLDGDLSDWTGVPLVTVHKGTMMSSDPAENGSFTFALAADLENIYVSVTTPDRTIIAGQHGRDFWNEDSFELYFNFTDDFYTRVYGEGIYQFNVNAADLGNIDPYGLTITGERVASHSVYGFVFKTRGGWGIEVAIPIAGEIEIAHGTEFGFQLQANGSSGGDRDVKLIWSNADTKDSSWQNPSLFGRALLFQIGRTDIPEPTAP